MAEPHPDEIPALSRTKIVQLENEIGYIMNNVYIINNAINLDKLLAIPYNIVITGFTTLLHIVKYLKDIPENTKKQFIGIYYSLDIEKQTAELLNSTICSGHISQYSSVEQFVQSFYKNAVIWRSIDLIPKFHIVLQIWKQTEPERLKELQMALYKNAINPYIHNIHISTDSEGALDILNMIPSNYLPKIKFFSVNGRLTYKNALEYISRLSANDFAAIINTDIYFDNTIRALWNAAIDNTCLALLRYETSLNAPDADAKLSNGDKCNCSQDAWIFKVKDVLKDRYTNPNWSNYDFTLGELGCDNTIITELLNNGWSVCNPCKTIKIYHLHNSNIRTYKHKNRITHGVYTFIMPSHILE